MDERLLVLSAVPKHSVLLSACSFMGNALSPISITRLISAFLPPPPTPSLERSMSLCLGPRPGEGARSTPWLTPLPKSITVDVLLCLS